MNEFYERRTQFQRVHLTCLPKKDEARRNATEAAGAVLLLAVSSAGAGVEAAAGGDAHAIWPRQRWQEPRISCL